MWKLVVKPGCDRCCELVGHLSPASKAKVIKLRSTGCTSFIGFGDVVEAVIHTFKLHIVWAWLHGREKSWVCPGCQRRKNWLNKHFYFGDKGTKALWLALIKSDYLPIDAQYPFLVTQVGNRYLFDVVSDDEIADPKMVNNLLEGPHV